MVESKKKVGKFDKTETPSSDQSKVFFFFLKQASKK